jgi:hypothetical protein
MQTTPHNPICYYDESAVLGLKDNSASGGSQFEVAVMMEKLLPACSDFHLPPLLTTTLFVQQPCLLLKMEPRISSLVASSHEI